MIALRRFLSWLLVFEQKNGKGRRKLVPTLGWSVLVLAVSMSFAAPRDVVWAGLFLLDVISGDDASLLKSISNSPVERTGSFRTTNESEIVYDLYVPAAETPAPLIVAAHGFTGDGKDDTRLKSFARSLARTGFMVLVPDLPDMKNYRLGFDDVADLRSCYRFARALPETDTVRIGVFGFSFGAGPVLISIADSAVAPPLKFAFVFGGYYNLKRAFRYTLTGYYDDAGFADQLQVRNLKRRWKFLLGNMDRVPVTETRDRFVEIVKLKAGHPELEVDSLLSEISPDEASVFRFMGNTDPERYDLLFSAMPEECRHWIDTLALHHYTEHIHTQLLISHSETDPVIPFTESLLLAENLTGGPQPVVGIMNLFSHVDLKLDGSSVGRIVQEIIPGIHTLWVLAFHLMQQRR